MERVTRRERIGTKFRKGYMKVERCIMVGGCIGRGEKEEKN